MVTHVRAHVCACGGWYIGVQAHPTFALGIFLQFSALHVVQLGLSIKPRDGRLMMLASQLSQESRLSLQEAATPTHLYTGFGDRNAGPHMLWQMLY